MRLLIPLAVLSLILASSASRSTEAPTGFDNKSNGVADDATHQADQTKFEEVEQLSDGLGPLYNAQSCRECHQSPVSGAASQVAELRVGHQGPEGHFRNPEIPIAHGAEVISGRSLVNDRAICPNAAFPDKEIQERVPETETIRTFRLSLSLLGDGFVEAVADQTLIDLAAATMQIFTSENLRTGSPGPYRGSARTDERRQVRLERPAREPAIVRRRRLPQ